MCIRDSLWKRHSAFPDFRLGYHVAEAMQGEAQWNAANACAGKVSLFGGLLAFVFFPAACLPLKLSTGRMALLYCCICLLWALSVLRIPLYLSLIHIYQEDYQHAGTDKRNRQ